MRTQDRRARQRLSPQARTDTILSSATTAFTGDTYDQVSMAAVAEAAGASESLVYKYFQNKAGLYTAVVHDQLERLSARQQQAVTALPSHTSARDQARVTIEAVLDHVKDRRAAWASPFFTGPSEPAAVQELRLRYRKELVAGLTAQLRNPDHRRARIAIVGFLGYLGAAAQHWVEHGCPPEDRAPLVESALGALEGSLGDWGSLRPPDARVTTGGGNRVRWKDLPLAITDGVAQLLGAPVVAAHSQPGGFSPGSADRVLTAEGRRAFVKAVSASINAESLLIHRREATVLPLLPPGLPTASLLGVVEDGDWIALVLTDVPGRHPALPWVPEELDRALDAYATLATVPVDERLAGELEPLGPNLPTGWSEVTAGTRLALATEGAAWCHDHLPVLRALEAEAVSLVEGDRLVHLDARADNLLLDEDGRVTIVDWPWAVRGAAWFDPLVLMVNVRLFDPAFDVDAVISRHPAFAGLPGEAISPVLAALAGFFAWHGSQPPPPGLPTLRSFQLEQAEVTLAWLRQRAPFAATPVAGGPR